MTRWLWLAGPVLVVTLLVPLGVAVAVTALGPAVVLQVGCSTRSQRCPSGSQTADPPGTSSAADVVLAFAASKAGGPYRMGATGPRTYDCSSLVQAAYARAGIRLPRTAAAQRDWLAAGHGRPIPVGREQRGDLLFWDSYRGPHQIGHVALVWDPGTRTTIDARNPPGRHRALPLHHRPSPVRDLAARLGPPTGAAPRWPATGDGLRSQDTSTLGRRCRPHRLGLPDDQPITWSPARMSRVSEANPKDAQRP